MASKEPYRTELRSAARQLADRCLHSAAKWAAELLVSLEPDPSSASATPPLSSLSSRSFLSASTSSLSLARRSDGSSLRRRLRSGEAAATPPGGLSYVSTPIPVEDGGEGDSDLYVLAKAYFDCREFRRAAHVLGKQTGRKAVFLRCYALYLRHGRFYMLLGGLRWLGPLMYPPHACVLLLEGNLGTFLSTLGKPPYHTAKRSHGAMQQRALLHHMRGCRNR